MSLSGNEFSTTSDKERTLAQCVGDPPASMAVSLMAFPVTRSPRTPRFTYPLVPVAAKRSGSSLVLKSGWKGAHSESFCSRQQC
jgi:hypothetical protein